MRCSCLFRFVVLSAVFFRCVVLFDHFRLYCVVYIVSFALRFSCCLFCVASVRLIWFVLFCFVSYCVCMFVCRGCFSLLVHARVVLFRLPAG